jgi:hypothetical protein
MVQTYSFPILDRREIVAYLLESGIGLELEEQQLLKPTMEVIWPLYESLVHSLMGISRYRAQLLLSFSSCCIEMDFDCRA